MSNSAEDDIKRLKLAFTQNNPNLLSKLKARAAESITKTITSTKPTNNNTSNTKTTPNQVETSITTNYNESVDNNIDDSINKVAMKYRIKRTQQAKFRLTLLSKKHSTQRNQSNPSHDDVSTNEYNSTSISGSKITNLRHTVSLSKLTVYNKDLLTTEGRVQYYSNLCNRSYNEFVNFIDELNASTNDIKLSARYMKDIKLDFLQTTNERKKLKHELKLEAERVKRDNIILGVCQPDDTKLSLSNMHRVYQQYNFMTPTEFEKKVKSQVAERLNEHLMQNAKRALTPKEKKQKTVEHWKQSLDDQYLCAFVLPKHSPSILIKVLMNLREYHITGAVISLDNDSYYYILAESGERAFTAMKKLFECRLFKQDDVNRHHVKLLFKCISALNYTDRLFDHIDSFSVTSVSLLPRFLKKMYYCSIHANNESITAVNK